MKKIIAINGSPRKKANTATLLQSALEGAESAGAKTKLIHLYKLEYTGCISCFACKRKDGKYNCRCAVKDDLSPVLEKILECDGLILGSPIYLGNITAGMIALLERLVFILTSYDTGGTNFKGNIPSAFIYNMNVTYEDMQQRGYDYLFNNYARYLEKLGGVSEYTVVNDTYQFKNYDKYAAARFDEKHKAKVRKEQFPIDCRNAYEIGRRLAGKRK